MSVATASQRLKNRPHDAVYYLTRLEKVETAGWHLLNFDVYY